MELRRRREAANLLAYDLAHQLGWSASKVSRMENGARGVSEVDAAIYLTFCGVRKEELEELLDLARWDENETWLQEHGERLPDELRTLVYHETTATTMAYYQPLNVPGLLQTTDYARALFEFAQVVPPARIPAALQVRAERQSVLRKPDSPQCLFYLHETALRSQVGNAQIMHEQLLQLVFLTARPEIDIRVVPASAGPHGAWGGPFMLMGYETHGPVIYVECLTTSLFLEKPRDLAAYKDVLSQLDLVALDTGQSCEWLANLASDFDKPKAGPDA
ncbi:MAG TPA: helix-turn-helix transcriptional regulator [Pseudonocardiaceae bacterium]|nr:helix-turn-helix transcriptional regulator [Pseudonocardiaceae bacterium]